MFRTTSNQLVRTSPLWRNASVCSSLKNYSTPASSTPATETKEQNSEKNDQQDEKKPEPLSARLGGTGRGKVIASADYPDPFASFLANAKKPRTQNNDRRNGNFTPRPRGQQGDNRQPGQFADAEGSRYPRQQQSRGPRPPRAEGENNNRMRTPRYQNVEGGAVKAEEGENRRPARTNNYNNADRNNNNNYNKPRDNNRNNTDGPRKNNRKMNLGRSQQPQEVRTRRAVTFIDKDIDWASFGTVKETTTDTKTTEEVKEDGELVLKEMQGDYQRYLNVGSEISWSQIINGSQVGTLVGSNPTFDLSQKTAFLTAVSKATSGGVAARK